MLDSYKLKEIRQYTATNLYKIQSKIDGLFKEYEQLKKLDAETKKNTDNIKALETGVLSNSTNS